MKSNFDIVIAGGGMVGAALACALGGSELKVVVLEQRPATEPAQGFDLRVSAITLASRAFLENIGAWPGIARRRLAPVRAMHVWDEGGSGHIEFDAAEMGEPELAYIIENSVIQTALAERAQQFANIHWLCPVEIAEARVGQELPEVVLADGRCLAARLLVGADGARSAVRAAAGLETRGVDLRQTSIVAAVRSAKRHDHIARQRFLATGPLAFLPLPEAHTCSIVWSADSARADELLALADAGFLAELQQAFGDALGGIESVSARAAFPLALSAARTYVRERLALIGDAAHTVHPLAGQGVNLGFLDAAELAELLTGAAAKRKDVGALALLRRYERARKGGNLGMVAVTGAFRYLFSNRLPVLTELRNLGLGVTNAVTPIKNLIMRRASGLEGDLPRLARRSATRG